MLALIRHRTPGALPKCTRKSTSTRRPIRLQARSAKMQPLSLSSPSKWRPSPIVTLALAAVPAMVIASQEGEQKEEEESVVEPRTGLKVPSILLGQPLVATSARSVTFLGFLTYAFALYRDSSKWSMDNVEAVIPGIIDDPSGTTFRITTYRSIDCTHFCSSINSGTIPRMKKALESTLLDSTKAAEQAEAIGQEFRSVFKTKDLPANTSVDFKISRSDPNSNNFRVTIYINGALEGHVDGPIFTNALVAIYFGADPRSNEIQNGIKASLHKSASVSKK